jgi:hypothetical protein
MHRVVYHNNYKLFFIFFTNLFIHYVIWIYYHINHFIILIITHDHINLVIMTLTMLYGIPLL